MLFDRIIRTGWLAFAFCALYVAWIYPTKHLPIKFDLNQSDHHTVELRLEGGQHAVDLNLDGALILSK